MRIEIILALITGVVIYNIYTDGKFIKTLYAYKKYYQMGAVALGALFLYYVFTKNPLQARDMLAASNDYMKYMPLDRNTTNMISPILNFTQTQFRGGNNTPIGNEQIYLGGMGPAPPAAASRILRSGDNKNKPTKRSVSETKKKFVAAQQNWRCGKCQKQLPAWFEVDHKTRLEYGGSNHIDNLVALCRDCHGEKTAIENL